MSVEIEKEERPRPVRSRSTQRIAFFVAGVGLVMSTLVVRLGYLQIRQSHQFDSVVAAQNYETLPIPGPRGRIIDAEGQVLASDQPDYSIVYVRYTNDASSAGAVAARLAPVLGIPAKTLYNQMININPDFISMTLVKAATPLEISYVAEHRNQLPGITMLVTPVRVYPMGYLAAHEIGYVGPIPSGEQALYKGYSPNAQVGLAGLEQEYQSVLRGRSGAEKIPMSALDYPLSTGVVNVPPKAGDNLILNLNGPLEKVAEQALIQRIQYLRNRGEPYTDSGSIVVMNVHTGAILAMASYPSYKPQWWVGGISPQHYQDYLHDDAGFNRAVGGLYMPGSAQKMLTAMTALIHHDMTPDMRVDDTGGLQIGDYYMHSWNPYGFGNIGLLRAIEVSDDTYFYQVGLDLGHWNNADPPSNIEAWLNGPRLKALKEISALGKQFGLTSLTGIDLPDEAVGYVDYEPPLLYSLPAAAIGQEEAYSPIGLATYIAAIATGYRVQPEMVHEITSPSGRVLKVFQPHIVDHVTVPEQYLQLMREGLELATHGSQGTATYFFGNDPINVAGKTGTAQTNIPGKNNSVFVGYAPYNDPQIAVAAVIPNVTGEGFHAAAPMAQTVIDAYFAMQKASGAKS
jgi:penicillin-binding protein 2